MADLSKSFAEVVAEIEKTKLDLAVKASELEKREASLEELERSVADKVHNLQIDQEEVNRKWNLIVKAEELKETEKATVEKIRELAQKKLEAVRTENALADMKMNLDKLERDLVEREKAVSRREKEYKEEVKKKFFEELQKQLPR